MLCGPWPTTCWQQHWRWRLRYDFISFNKTTEYLFVDVYQQWLVMSKQAHVSCWFNSRPVYNHTISEPHRSLFGSGSRCMGRTRVYMRSRPTKKTNSVLFKANRWRRAHDHLPKFNLSLFLTHLGASGGREGLIYKMIAHTVQLRHN